MGIEGQYPAPAAPPQKKGIPPLLMIGGGVVICVIIGCVGIIGLGMYAQAQDQRNYEAGHAAYLAGNCAEAIAAFDELTGEDNIAMAAPERSHCETFQQAMTDHQSGRYGAALHGYLTTVETSAALDVPVTQQLDALFGSAHPEQIASDEVCGRGAALGGFTRFAAIDANLPGLYAECGDYYAAAARFDEATEAYDLFLTNYPNHELAGDVEAALAAALLSSAKAAGAGNIPAPELSGSTGTGDAQVVIQNDSPESMRIVFTGPETRIEELEACTTCETFSVVGPAFCPEQGPVGEYTLPPGTYEVLVESRSDSSTTPFVGTWELAGGDVYSSCFFIVESLGP